MGPGIKPPRVAAAQAPTAARGICRLNQSVDVPRVTRPSEQLPYRIASSSDLLRAARGPWASYCRFRRANFHIQIAAHVGYDLHSTLKPSHPYPKPPRTPHPAPFRSLHAILMGPEASLYRVILMAWQEHVVKGQYP